MGWGATRIQGRTACAIVQDAAKGAPCIKGNENPKHFAIDLVSFVDAKHQTQSTIFSEGGLKDELAAGELCSYFV